MTSYKCWFRTAQEIVRKAKIIFNMQGEYKQNWCLYLIGYSIKRNLKIYTQLYTQQRWNIPWITMMVSLGVILFVIFNIFLQALWEILLFY